MQKIVYKKTNGKAHDLRFVKTDYEVQVNEIIIEGDKLPDITTLHSSDHIEKLNLETQRINDAKNALDTLREKHKGKKMSELADADVLEFMRLEMAREMGLEL